MTRVGETPSESRCVVCGYAPEDPDGIFQEMLELHVCYTCLEPVEWLVGIGNSPEVALDCVQAAFRNGQDIELCCTCRRPLRANTIASDGAFLYCQQCAFDAMAL